MPHRDGPSVNVFTSFIVFDYDSATRAGSGVNTARCGLQPRGWL